MSTDIKEISAKSYTVAEYLSRLYSYRHLVRVLALRDLKATYTQTYFGWLWMAIKPLLVLLLFTVLFDQWLAVDTGQVNYPVFAFAGMSIWYFFSNLVNATGMVLMHSTDLIQKIYFPRIILLLSKSLVALVELGVNLLLLLLLIIGYGYSPQMSWLIVIPVVLVVYISGLTIGVWVSSLSVVKRDLQHLVPHLVNLAIWVTPVFYPVSIIPEAYRGYLYWVNPIATSIDFFRAALFNTGDFPAMIYINVLLIIGLFYFGLLLFIRKEKSLIDNL